jgi:hypothetical protein
MGENGLEYVRQRHNPDVIARTYLKLFTDLRSGGGPMVFRDVGNGISDRSVRERQTESVVVSLAQADRRDDVPFEQ